MTKEIPKCELCNKEDFTLIVDEKKVCIKCYDKFYRRIKDYTYPD